MSAPTVSGFEASTTFEDRIKESQKIIEKFPDRVPVIVERAAKASVPDLDKCKYLVPRDLSVGKFLYVVRKRIRLAPEHALFLYVNGQLPATHELISKVYQDHKKEDGFLYMTYNGESTFGGFSLVAEDL